MELWYAMKNDSTEMLNIDILCLCQCSFNIITTDRDLGKIKS